MTTPGGTDSSKKTQEHITKLLEKNWVEEKETEKLLLFFLSEIHMKKRNKQFFFPAPSKWRTKKEDVKNWAKEDAKEEK